MMMSEVKQAEPPDEPSMKTFSELREELDVAVQMAELIPCPEAWARVVTVRRQLSRTTELQYARAAINQRAVRDEVGRRNVPGANRW
jgi:hypothetical protein